MPFGDVISKSEEEIELATGDNQRVVVDTAMKKLGLKIFGIPHTEMRNRARLLLKNSKFKKGYKILDAGCGIGLYTLYYAIRNSVKVIGIDLNKDRIKNAEKLKKSIQINDIEFLEGDLTELNFENEHFDFIICSDVLEHISDDGKALEELTRVLKRNGTLLITFPFPSQRNEGIMEKFGHVRAGYNKEMITELATKNKLSIEKLQGYTYFFGKIAWYINERTFSIPILTALTFYPLYLLTYLDFTKIGEPNGLFVRLRKI